MTPTAQELYDRLGPWKQADDGTLAALVASLADQWDSVAQIVSDSDDGPGWSAALDVDRCPSWLLPWLGQWVGVRVPAGADADTMRSAIRNEAGFARGTLVALQAAAAKYLKPGYTIQILERTDDAYTLTAHGYISWLLGDSYAELSAAYPTYTDLGGAFATYDLFSKSTAALTSALQDAKPAGLVLTVDIQTSAHYSDLTSGWSTYTALTAEFPTYDVMTTYVP